MIPQLIAIQRVMIRAPRKGNPDLSGWIREKLPVVTFFHAGAPFRDSTAAEAGVASRARAEREYRVIGAPGATA